MTPKIAPCERTCPAGIDVPRYVRHIRDGRFDQALAVIRERIPFPLVCGYACAHPCEAACARRQYDQAVAIRLLKRAAADHGWSAPAIARAPATGKRVAVVGSGPCGLTAAWYLARLGHEVTVFEALELAGGMLRHGIPEYRLPDAVIDADIAQIAQAGVTILTGRRIASAQALLDEGFAAVLLASGAWRPARMGIPGDDGPGVLDGIVFLRAVNAGAPPAIGRRVVVVGGGDTAIDAARVSRRLGAEVVQVYRRTRAEMPATEEEIAAAIEEGVAMDFLAAPVRIAPGTVTCIRMALAGTDAGGRPRPEPVPGSDYAIAADTVIMAVGQRVDVPAGMTRAGNGAIAADAETLATGVAGLFAGGDAVSGPATIIDAIAQGRRAAAAIDRFLGGGGDLERFAQPKPDAALEDSAERGDPRRDCAMTALPERLSGFGLAELGFDRQLASDEAGRCLSCDLRTVAVRVDPARCKDCGYCKEVCGLGVFERLDEFNAGGYRPYVAERPERCIGCLACLYICPDFAITIG